MPVAARRTFRLSLIVALALAGAYAFSLPLPFLAPLFAFLLAAPPKPPMGLKSLIGLILAVLLTLGIGLLLIPAFTHYPVSAVLMVAVGLYFSSYLTINKSRGAVGTLLTVGFTLIPAAGTVSYSVAVVVIQSLALGIGLAIICQWLVYPWFPEDAGPAEEKKPVADAAATRSGWIALRTVLIVLPPFLLCLTNPSMYLPTIMKSVLLGQQGSVVSARAAGRELLGSTFLGGCFAVLFWFALKIHPNLWMFFLWMLLFGVYFSSKLYRLIASRFPPSFWLNTAVTMLILLGPAVQDSAGGKDVSMAFAVRMGLFVSVTLYAWLAVYTLELLRTRRLTRLSVSLPDMESPRC
jgi:hypothetical protein